MRPHSLIEYRRAERLINTLCDIAHGTTELRKLTNRRFASHLCQAIVRGDNNALYSWLMNTFSYQGLSDQAARKFIEEHGNAEFTDISNGLESSVLCDKLKGFWTFKHCYYQKARQSCSCARMTSCCPLPRPPLRNGRLNQTAFSLYFFIRDVAGGDLIRFVDRLIEALPENASPREVHDGLVPPWKGIFGISDKVVSMALATLLLSAPASKPRWKVSGQRLIVIDTLVHNFLHRTGLNSYFGRPHSYGTACYEADGCFDVLDQLSNHVDARRFDANFPAYFPRFVQLAIWRFCSQSYWGLCNGLAIDDSKRCRSRDCYLRSDCQRVALKG
jgi:hypothetical protein